MRKLDRYKQKAADIVREDYWIQVGAFLIQAPIAIGIILCLQKKIICVILLVLLRILWNLFTVGLCWFSLRAQKGGEKIRDVYTVLGDHPGNVILTMMVRDLWVMLLSVLLVFPGVMRAYSLRLVPWILAEHPETPMREVFRQSDDLMHGERARCFQFDLSFLGWLVLVIITGGIAGIFWVSPYYSLSNSYIYQLLVSQHETMRAFTAEDFDDYEEPDENSSDDEVMDGDALYGAVPGEYGEDAGYVYSDELQPERSVYRTQKGGRYGRS